MPFRLQAIALTLMSALLVSGGGPALAQAVEHPTAGSTLRATLLDAARPVFASETNGPIEFVVHQLNVWGGWAFGDVKLQRPGGRSIDWNRTRFGEDVEGGMFDPGASFFLLRRVDGQWSVIEHAAGPTDIPWDAWRMDHKLPQELFERPNVR